jgi:hypothetical protein
MKHFNEALCALDKAERLLVEARIEIGKAWAKTAQSKPSLDEIMQQVDELTRKAEVAAYADPGSLMHAEMRAERTKSREKLKQMVIDYAGKP